MQALHLIVCVLLTTALAVAVVAFMAEALAIAMNALDHGEGRDRHE